MKNAFTYTTTTVNISANRIMLSREMKQLLILVLFQNENDFSSSLNRKSSQKTHYESERKLSYLIHLIQNKYFQKKKNLSLQMQVLVFVQYN